MYLSKEKHKRIRQLTNISSRPINNPKNNTNMLRKLAIFIFPLLIWSCNANNDKADAYGNFESEEILVSAKNNGVLEAFRMEEGMQLKQNQTVGYIDTSHLHLQKLQQKKKMNALKSQFASLDAQIDVQEQQLRNLLIEKDRIERLLRDEAATQQQFDQIDGQVKVARKQIKASQAKYGSLHSEMEVLEQQIALTDLQIRDAEIVNPVKGVVLEKYAEENEMVMAGHHLYKIADLSTMDLRVYVSGAQLSGIKIGQQVKVFIDENKHELSEMEGTVSWIAHSAEFTPKIIQTREERVDLVYAVIVKVKNDGRLKIGMPGEISLQYHTIP